MDVCICDGGSPCVFSRSESEVKAAAGVIHLIVCIVAEIVMVGAIIGAVKHRAESLNHAWRTLALLPPFFTGVAGMDSATWESLRRLRATDEYWFRAAADQVCNGYAIYLPIAAHGYANSSFDCSDSGQIGPPDTQRGTHSTSLSASCNAGLSSLPGVAIAGHLVYTLIFNVVLLSCVSYHFEPHPSCTTHDVRTPRTPRAPRAPRAPRTPRIQRIQRTPCTARTFLVFTSSYRVQSFVVVATGTSVSTCGLFTGR